MQLTQHALSALWPAMADDEMIGLENDIRKHGVLEPITLHDGEVLDGWHRYQTALKLGIQCEMMDYDGEDPAGFVISMNAHRRQMPQLTKARVVARCREWHPPHRATKEADHDDPLIQPPTPSTDSDMSGHSVVAPDVHLGTGGAVTVNGQPVDTADPTMPDPEPETHTLQEMADEAGTSRSTMKRAVAEVREEQAAAGDAPEPRPRQEREKQPSLRQKFDDTANMLSAAKRENTALKRRIEELERIEKLRADADRPDLAARIAQLVACQKELEAFRAGVQTWQQRFGEEQRRNAHLNRVLRENHIDPNA